MTTQTNHQAMSVPPADRILRLPEVARRVGLCESSIYFALSMRGREKGLSFPKPRRLAGRAVGWLESEINHWLQTRELAAAEEV